MGRGKWEAWWDLLQACRTESQAQICPKEQKQVLEHQDCHHEKTGSISPLLSFCRSGTAATLVGWAGLVVKKDQWSLLE